MAATGAAAGYGSEEMRFGAPRSRGVAAPLLMVVTFVGATAPLALPRPAGRKAPPAATGSRGIPANNEPVAGRDPLAATKPTPVTPLQDLTFPV